MSKKKHNCRLYCGTYWRCKKHNEPKCQATFILDQCLYAAI